MHRATASQDVTVIYRVIYRNRLYENLANLLSSPILYFREDSTKKGKGKGSPYNRPLGPRGWVEVYPYPFMTSALRWGLVGQHHAPAALPPGKTRYPLYRRLGGLQGRSWRVRKIWPPTGIRSPDRPARGESLYRLSYSGPVPRNVGCMNYIQYSLLIILYSCFGNVTKCKYLGATQI